jgi:hypothetical protein
MKRWWILAVALIFGAVIIKFWLFSPSRALVTLSDSSSCELRSAGFFHWFTDRRVPLVYRKDGQEIGRVEFRFTPGCAPVAIFPTEDKENLFCLSRTDFSIALFVIELNTSAAPDHAVPIGFFNSNPPIITFTNFALRRCTREEVNYLKRFARSLNDEALARFYFWRFPSAESVISDIDVATSPPRVPLKGDLPEVSYEKVYK